MSLTAARSPAWLSSSGSLGEPGDRKKAPFSDARGVDFLEKLPGPGLNEESSSSGPGEFAAAKTPKMVRDAFPTLKLVVYR